MLHLYLNLENICEYIKTGLPKKILIYCKTNLFQCSNVILQTFNTQMIKTSTVNTPTLNMQTVNTSGTTNTVRFCKSHLQSHLLLAADLQLQTWSVWRLDSTPPLHLLRGHPCSRLPSGAPELEQFPRDTMVVHSEHVS